MYERLRRELKDAYAFNDELIDGIINYISTNPGAYEQVAERLKEKDPHERESL